MTETFPTKFEPGTQSERALLEARLRELDRAEDEDFRLEVDRATEDLLKSRPSLRAKYLARVALSNSEPKPPPDDPGPVIDWGPPRRPSPHRCDFKVSMWGPRPRKLPTTAQANLSDNSHRQRKPRRPSLASVSKQARKVGIDVARYEIKPDGTVVVVAGQPQANDTEINPWDQVFTNAPKRPS